MLAVPAGPFGAESARVAAHAPPFVPLVEHVISGAAANVMSPVSFVVNRGAKVRSAMAGATNAHNKIPHATSARTHSLIGTDVSRPRSHGHHKAVPARAAPVPSFFMRRPDTR